MKITCSAQYDNDAKHDKTYKMKAEGLNRIGKTTKIENFKGHTLKFTFAPDSNFSSRLTECEARTMKELKAKIRKQLL